MTDLDKGPEFTKMWALGGSQPTPATRVQFLTSCDNVLRSGYAAIMPVEPYSGGLPLASSYGGSLRRPTFSWTGRYSYPFASYSNEDCTLLRCTVDDWKKADLVDRPVTYPINGSQTDGLVGDQSNAPPVDLTAETGHSHTIDASGSGLVLSQNLTEALAQIELELSHHTRQIGVLTRLRTLLTSDSH